VTRVDGVRLAALIAAELGRPVALESEPRPEEVSGVVTVAYRQSAWEYTLRADADPARLAEHLLANADESRKGPSALPEELRGGAAEIGDPQFSWSALGVSESLRHAFSAQTCNGCHGGDSKALPFRHIAPSTRRERPAQVSRFLYEPDAPYDELRRRSDVLDTWSQTFCEPIVDDGAYPRFALRAAARRAGHEDEERARTIFP
jgi:hypothetical protein